MNDVLGTGRQCTVRRVDANRVARSHDGRAAAEREATLLRHLAARAFPVPAVYGVTEHETLMEYVEGPTMLAAVASEPRSFVTHARTLATLHRALHAIEPPAAVRLIGPGGSLLHLDLHPGNVLLSPDGPVVIDWTTAAVGAAAVDVAMTALTVGVKDDPGASTIEPAGRQAFLAAFLRHFDLAEVADGLPRAIELLLADPLATPQEQERVERLAAEGAMACLLGTHLRIASTRRRRAGAVAQP